MPDSMPKSLLVIGSGAIGIEFASFYRTLGAEVTVVEVLDRILPVEDEEISAFAHKAFEKQGMKIRTAPTVEAPEERRRQRDGTIEARTARPRTITVDRVIVAVGIVGNVENLGLEGAGREGRPQATSSSTSGAAPASPASTPSATSPARPGWRTRRATRASSASRRSPA